MSSSKSPSAYSATRDLLDAASDSPRGLLYRCGLREAHTVRTKIGSVRRALAEESTEIYQLDDPQYGRSPYDHLFVYIVAEGIAITPEPSSSFAENPRASMHEALDKNKNVRIEFPTPSALVAFRRRCYAIREADRNLFKHLSGHPMSGKSRFDTISFLIINPTVLELQVILETSDFRIEYL